MEFTIKDTEAFVAGSNEIERQRKIITKVLMWLAMQIDSGLKRKIGESSFEKVAQSFAGKVVFKKQLSDLRIFKLMNH